MKKKENSKDGDKVITYFDNPFDGNRYVFEQIYYRGKWHISRYNSECSDRKAIKIMVGLIEEERDVQNR